MDFTRKYNNDKWVLITICFLAALRIFIYAAAFPFFSNIDEQAHLDLVIKYSQGHAPHSIEKLSAATAYYIPRYESPEYFNIPTEQSGGTFQSPPWTKPAASMQRYYNEGAIFWSNNYTNHESSQAPVYYQLAALWTNLGFTLGITEGYLLYWIRFLNILYIIALVIIAANVASTLFPDDRFINIGLPLLVAFIPQDSYYSIQNDVLSPVLYGLAFLYLIRFIKSEFKSNFYGLATGISLAITMLVKTANLPLAFIVLIATLFIAIKNFKLNKSTLLPLLLFLICTIVPVAIWMMGNYTNYGDITASEEKIKILGWTHKSISNWYPHPVFSLAGFWEFISGLLSSFWRGEMIWWTKPIANRFVDVFYIVSSILVVAITCFGNKHKKSGLLKQSNTIALFSFLSLMLFMAVLSLSFDFGNCENPSQAHPYFVSGRLITAALIPFALLYLQGIGILLKGIQKDSIKIFILIVILLIITISEYTDHAPVFASQYNFYHLK